MITSIINNILFLEVPFTPPNNTAVFPLSSTTIGVMWDNVQEIDQNGVLISFEILYVPLETFLFSNKVNTSASNRSLNLTGLQEYVEYNISVRAYTSVGAGPYSNDVTVRTHENGKCYIVHVRNKLTKVVCSSLRLPKQRYRTCFLSY